MLFDINAALGHWPFRRIPNQSAPELRRLLSGAGIDGAAVANTHGLFYKNCHDANRELVEWIADHGDFFVGVATLNPLYAAWERDLKECAAGLGFRALRLAPQYHDYALGSREAAAIAGAATERGMPLLVPHRVVDTRQRHWFDTERTTGLDDIGALCQAVPAARVIVTEGVFGPQQLLTAEGAWKQPGLYVEMSRMVTGRLPAEVVAERMVFGTGAPFKEVLPALLKLRAADLTAEQRNGVGGLNARKLLGL